MKELQPIRIDQGSIDWDLIDRIDLSIGIGAGDRIGMAHTFFPDGNFSPAFLYRAGERYATDLFRRSFGGEGKFGSITRSAKLYSTTRAVLRR
jgi:hypothetical protein